MGRDVVVERGAFAPAFEAGVGGDADEGGVEAGDGAVAGEMVGPMGVGEVDLEDVDSGNLEVGHFSDV